MDKADLTDRIAERAYAQGSIALEEERPLPERLRASCPVVELLAAGKAGFPGLYALVVCDNLIAAAVALEAAERERAKPEALNLSTNPPETNTSAERVNAELLAARVAELEKAAQDAINLIVALKDQRARFVLERAIAKALPPAAPASQSPEGLAGREGGRDE